MGKKKPNHDMTLDLVGSSLYIADLPLRETETAPIAYGDVTCDVLISGGMIIDGTGCRRYRGDVAIQAGKIVAVGEIAAPNTEKVIDATGSVVCPGFIDVHAHNDWVLATPENKLHFEPFLRQGITTSVNGNCGVSFFPSTPDAVLLSSKRAFKEQSTDTYQDYASLVQAAGPVMNTVNLIGFGTVRQAVIGDERAPSREEIRTMQHYVDLALKQGSAGCSFGGEYYPQFWSRWEEIAEVTAPLGKYRGIMTCHLRSMGEWQTQAVEEMLRVAVASQPRHLQISHMVDLETYDQRNMMRQIGLLEQAERCYDFSVGYDMVAYITGNTGPTALYPRWMFDQGVDTFYQRLAEPAHRNRLKETWAMADAGQWSNDMEEVFSGGTEVLVYAPIGGLRLQNVNEEYRAYEGMHVSQAAQVAGVEPYDFYLDYTRAHRGTSSYIVFGEGAGGAGSISSEREQLTLIHQFPRYSFETDAVGVDDPTCHTPSLFGTFPRVLGEFVREWKILTLEEAIRKATSLPAKQIGIADRGVLEEGKAADIVIFDPETIASRATFETPRQFPLGIDAVIVNGELSVSGQEYLGPRVGKVLRAKDGVVAARA